MENQASTVKEPIIIVWFNDPAMGDSSHMQKVKEQLEQNSVGILTSFDDSDECIHFINDVNDYQIILILGPLTGAKVLRNVLHVSKIQAVFIVCQNRSMYPPWANERGSLRCIPVNNTSICEQIEIFIENRTVGIDILDSPIIQTNGSKQDLRFMYSQLVKYILTEMTYTNNDTTDMIEFFENKYKNQSITMKSVKEFGNNYETNNAIRCYTNYTFLYTTLNSALRTLDICAMYSMRVFLKDLHRQIIKLHATKQITQILKLYRGLVISTVDFEKIKEKTGKLLMFSNFLSTSANKDVALMFAGSSPVDETAIIFEITIDPSMSTSVAFTCVQSMSQYEFEEEYLFTMGSIFRIESIEQLAGNPNWCIHLTLTTDDDPETVQLTKYMQSQIKQPSLERLYELLIYLDKYEQAIDIVNTCIKSCKDTSQLPRLYTMVGGIYMQMGNSQLASEALQLSRTHSNQLDASEDNILQTNLTTLLNNLLHGNLDLALINIETIKENAYKLFNDTTDHKRTKIFASIDMVKGVILQRQGHYKDALRYQNEAFNTLKENVPAAHPMKIFLLLSIFFSFEMNGQLDDASLCMQEMIQMQKHSLPPEHFLRIALENITLDFCDNNNLPSEYSIDNIFNDTKDPVKLSLLCSHHVKNKKWDEALSVIDRYMKLNVEHEHMYSAYFYYARGICYVEKKYLIEALNDCKRSYEIGIQHLGKTHELILSSLASTAAIYFELDNSKQALDIIEQCKTLIATCSELYSTDRKKVLFQPIFLAFKSRIQSQICNNEYEKVLLELKHYLSIQIYVYSEDHSEVGDTYLCIAMIYKELSNYRDALYNYKKAQNIIEKCLSFNRLLIGKMWNDLRLIYFELQQYDEALFACNKYLKCQEDTLPLDSISIAQNYQLIASIYIAQHKYVDSIENYHRALTIALEYLPETRFETIRILQGLAHAYKTSHQYEESIMAFYECLEYRLNVLPSNHTDILNTYTSLTLIYLKLNKYEETLRCLESCLLIQMSLLPPDHSCIATTQEHMGYVAYKLQKLSLAASHYECALDIKRKHLPTTNAEIIKILKFLASIYSQMNRHDDAKRTLIECRNLERILKK